MHATINSKDPDNRSLEGGTVSRSEAVATKNRTRVASNHGLTSSDRATRSHHRLTCDAFALLLLFILAVSPARAADPENCLSCHRYRGLARIDEDGKTVHLYHLDPNYYDQALGPHSRLQCTACHPREQVAVIPHQPVSPVNCTSACHLSSPGAVEVTFSHAPLKDMLETSAHTLAALDKSNELLGKPLHDGESRCLLCHDEPTFTRHEQPWVTIQANVARCAVCHDNKTLAELNYSFRHVHARSAPARTHEEVTRLCAICHSNPAVRKEFNLPDSTASYLASFHGKAMLLGSRTTANCLDCHVGEMENVHLMKSPKNPASSVHREKLSDTCRSAECHPSAGERISSAAIHLDLAASGGIEYFIAAVFVLLILFTFGPSVLLQTLELLHLVVGRYDPRHHEHRALADRMRADPKGRAAIKRFTVHQRVQHWILFVSFTALVLTGFPIKFADRGWASWLINLLGGLTVTRFVHRWAGALLLVGFFYHFLYVGYTMLKKKRASGRTRLQAIMDLPMAMNAADLRHLMHLLAYLLCLRRTRPDADRFSLKEKFEYFGVFWGTCLLGVTGLLMWASPWTSLYFPGRVLTVAALIHTFEAFLALLHVGVIHIIGVIFAPNVFPFSPAMVTGDTPAEELAEGHAGYLIDAARRTGIAPAEEGHHG